MEKKLGLSETEYELMEFFWDADHKLSFKEILDYFNNVKEKGWKKQTLSSFLTILQSGGFIQVDKSGRKYLYYPTETREEHTTNWVRQLCEISFGNSLGKFVAAFTGGKKLNRKDAEELKEYLQEFDDE